jgi:hypothetical protein
MADHSERIAELEAELAQIEADLVAGHAEKSHADLMYERGQVMRRIAQRRQDEEAKAIAAQQAEAAERAELVSPERSADGDPKRYWNLFTDRAEIMKEFGVAEDGADGGFPR